MTPIDWFILALFGLSILGSGWWVGRRQENTQEYYTGSVKMNPLLMGVLIAGLPMGWLGSRLFPRKASL
jgi:Na+/proline symporter